MYRLITAMHAPNLDLIPAITSDCSDLVYVGTDSGALYVLSAIEQTLRKVVAISWRSIFSFAQKLYDKNPIVAIKVNKRKPHRILVAFKLTGAVIYSLRVTSLHIFP